MKELIKKLRIIEIRIRKAINTQMQGDFHSVFKGSGLEFEDVRAYQYGDDVRTIDWNVSAKGHGTFIKTFKEEKEQTVFFMVDVSASQEIGTAGRMKLDIGKEICGVLALSAIKESSNVGLIAFSDQRELYVRPHKGINQAYTIINELFALQPKSSQTNLKNAMALASTFIKRRSVLILISDFIDTDYESGLKSLARKHDLVLIHLHDRKESELPNLGILPVFDKEKERTIWVNTSSDFFRNSVAGYFEKNNQGLKELARKIGADYLAINTEEDYVPRLIKLFKVKNRAKKRG